MKVWPQISPRWEGEPFCVGLPAIVVWLQPIDRAVFMVEENQGPGVGRASFGLGRKRLATGADDL